MQHFAIHRDLFHRLAALVKDGSARSFVYAAALYSDEAIFHEVRAPNAMFPPELVQGLHDLERAHFFSVHRDRVTAFESDLHVFRTGWRFLGCDGELEHALGWFRPRVFKDTAFVGNVQQVAIHRIGFLCRRFNGNVVALAVIEHRLAPGELLAVARFAPRRNHADVGHERVGGNFKTDLVVAFARRAVRDGLRLVFPRDFDHALGDQGAGDGRAEEIAGFVHRAGAEHRENEVAREFLAEIVNVDFGSAGLPCFFAQAAEFLFLAEVCREGDDFSFIGFLQPLQDDGRIQATGICEYNLHEFHLFLSIKRDRNSCKADARSRV